MMKLIPLLLFIATAHCKRVHIPVTVKGQPEGFRWITPEGKTCGAMEPYKEFWFVAGIPPVPKPLTFKTQAEAEAYIEQFCQSDDKAWK